MEVIMEYHILFIVIAFVLLLVSVLFLFEDNTKEKTIAAMILCAINYLICMLCSFGFFGIGLIGIDSSGEAVVTAHHEMVALYVIFFLLYWINIVFLFYGYWLWVRNPWKIGETGSSNINSDKNTYY